MTLQAPITEEWPVKGVLVVWAAINPHLSTVTTLTFPFHRFTELLVLYFQVFSHGVSFSFSASWHHHPTWFLSLRQIYDEFHLMAISSFIYRRLSSSLSSSFSGLPFSVPTATLSGFILRLPKLPLNFTPLANGFFLFPLLWSLLQLEGEEEEEEQRKGGTSPQ